MHRHVLKQSRLVTGTMSRYVLVSLKMGTGKKLIKNTDERHEAMNMHEVHTNKNRVPRELEVIIMMMIKAKHKV